MHRGSSMETWSAKLGNSSRLGGVQGEENSECMLTMHPLTIQDFFVRNPLKRLPHPFYSPDISLLDFDLFGKIKIKLIGREISDEISFLEPVTKILNGISNAELRRPFRNWIEHVERVIDARGSYLTKSIFSSFLSHAKPTPLWLFQSFTGKLIILTANTVVEMKTCVDDQLSRHANELGRLFQLPLPMPIHTEACCALDRRIKSVKTLKSRYL
jgi:hypothetical protein